MDSVETAWAKSPMGRAVDLLNQAQILIDKADMHLEGVIASDELQSSAECSDEYYKVIDAMSDFIDYIINEVTVRPDRGMGP